jgi:hypothetical protein
MPRALPATLLSLALLTPVSLTAQSPQPSMPDMPGMEMNAHPSNHDESSSTAMKMDQGMNMMKPPTNLIETELAHTTSGTSVEPPSTPVSMLMSHYRGWMVMLHGTAFIADTQQHAASDPTGPSPATCEQFNVPCAPPVIRGGDKLFSANWLMPMATRQLGQNGKYGQLTLRAMFSLEPATITDRQYP